MDSSLLIVMLLFVLYHSRISENNGLKSLSDYIRSIKIDTEYTKEKINLLKKIGPYLPKEYIATINKAILFTEKIMRINELANFMKYSEYQYIDETIPIKDNKERISKIINIVQREFSKADSNNIGMIMDLIVNLDNYKNLIATMNSLNLNEENLKDPARIINMLGPLLGIDLNKDKEKLKDINKMMEIVKMLNSKKETNKKTDDIKKLPDKDKNHLKDN